LLPNSVKFLPIYGTVPTNSGAVPTIAGSYILLTLPFHVSGSISNIDGAEYHCNKTQVRKVISGVVGAASSVTSIQVANLLRLFRIPQVSVVLSS